MTRGGRRLTFAVIAIAAFLTTLDNTVVNVALPAIRRDLDLSLAALQWVVLGYVLAFSGLMLTGGRLADVYGRRRVLLAGLSVFTAASAVAGSAGDAVVLLAARVVQGGGAALVVPAALAIITVGRTDRERDLGAAAWMGALAAALALGPFAGGWLSQHLHWTWIFWINVPPGVAGVVIGRLAIEESRLPAAPRVDLPGLLASGLALLAVTYALIEGHDVGWGSPLVAGTLAAGAVAAMIFVRIERRTDNPMIDLRLCRRRAFAGGVLAQVLWGLGVNGVFFFTSLFLQNVLRFSATRTGLAFVPLAALVVLVTPLTPWLVARAGAAATVATGLGLVAAGLVRVAFLDVGDGLAPLLPGLAAIGVGSALTVPLVSSVLATVPDSRAGMAGSVLSVAREVSGVFGIAAIGVIVTARQDAAVRAGRTAAAAFLDGYSWGLLTAAALVLTGAVVSLLTLPGRRAVPAPARTGVSEARRAVS